MYMHRTMLGAGARSRWGLGAGVALAVTDVFHVALSMNVLLLFAMCVALYTTLMLLWTGLYVAIDHPGVHCGIAPLGESPSFYRAFAFSMETMTTIGYGFPNEGNVWDEVCTPMIVVIYFQAMIFILLNASVVGVIFARVGSAYNRASQIIFSDKAVIRCVRNHFYFMFQVGEASFFTYHPVVEAHVRVYAILHEEITRLDKSDAADPIAGSTNCKTDSSRAKSLSNLVDAPAAAAASALSGDHSQRRSVKRRASMPSLNPHLKATAEEAPNQPPKWVHERAYFQTRVMRLTNPNDELGGMLFLATPQVVSHRIDPWSPLFPPAAHRADRSHDHDGKAYHFPGLVFREADREVALNDTAAGIPSSPKVAPTSPPTFMPRRRPSPLKRSNTEGDGTWTSMPDLPVEDSTSLPSPSPSPPSPPAAACQPRVTASAPNTPSQGSSHKVLLDEYDITLGSGGSGVDRISDLEPLPEAVLTEQRAQRRETTREQRVQQNLDHFLRMRGQSSRRQGNIGVEFADTGPKATRGQLKRMQELIRQHLQRSRLEVIVVVEAQDPHSSKSFQARHSYTADEIEFDKNFAACMSVDPKDGMARLNWNLFHKVYPVPFNTTQIIGGSHS